MFDYLIGLGYSCLDPKTGDLKVANLNVPLFHEKVDCNQFLDEASLFETADLKAMMVWFADIDDRCKHVTPWMETYTGLPLSAFLNSGWTDIIHPEDYARSLQYCQQSMRARQPFQNRYRMLRRDTRRDKVWGVVIDHGVPWYRLGEFVGYMGTVHEVGVWWEPPAEPSTTAAPSLAEWMKSAAGKHALDYDFVMRRGCDYQFFVVKHHEQDNSAN